MTKPALALALAAAATLCSAGCGMRGDPRPPLRRTPPPITDLVLSQQGDRIVLEFGAPAVSIDAVPLREMTLDILTAGGDGDFRKVARKRSIRAKGGEHIQESEPLPPVGFPFRVAVLGGSGSPPGPVQPTKVLVPLKPPPAPQNLRAQPVADGIRLRWAGDVPEAPPPVLASPAVSAASPPTLVPGKPASPPGAGTAATGAGSSAAASASAVPVAPAAPALPAAPPAPPGFIVYRRAAPNGRALPLFALPQPDRSFVDTTASPGAEWCYLVRAVAGVDPVRGSASSNEVCLNLPSAEAQP